MQKVITLRFSAPCKKCGLTVMSGERAHWFGAGGGVQHLECGNGTDEEILKPTPVSGATKTHTVTWANLRATYTGIAQDDRFSRWDKFPINSDRVSNVVDKDADWTGATDSEMLDFIKNGYRVEGLENVTSLFPSRPRRKLKFSDEGDELHIDLAWAGVDEPFSDWEKRNTKPGLVIEISQAFHINMPIQTIVAYQRWIARALQTLDENGVDMDVSIVTRVQKFTEDEGTTYETKIQVRKAGEAADFSNWSAMFSPGGYRILTHLATVIHAEGRGERIIDFEATILADRSYRELTGRKFRKVRATLGAPITPESFDIRYDDERNLIAIEAPSGDEDTTFPEFEMTEKLRAVLNKMNG
jgi:hypothetical protein